MVFPEKHIRIIVSLLQKFYLILTLGILLTTPVIFIVKGVFSATDFISIFIGATIYLGLKMRKFWIVPVKVILSSLGLISVLFYQPKNVLLLVIKLFIIALTSFEIYFFTRKEVRKYFKAKGLFLFGR